MQTPKKTLLLVEDEALIALTEKLSLEKYGYTVLLAGNGKKAVEAVETCPEIDLILMDINLGDGMDGTEAAELILREFDIPIVFVSSHSEREIVEKTEKLTSYGYVLKNSSITVLDASIKMAFKLFEANYKAERSEEYFRHSFEHAALGVCYVSMDGKFQRANKAFQSMLGYSEEELTNLRFNDITFPNDAPVGREVMAQLISGQIAKSTFEKRYLRKNGSVFWATVSTSLVKSKGLPDHFITQIIDIDAHKQTEEALRQSEQRYKGFLTNLDAGIVVHGPDTSIIMSNPRASELLGLSEQQMKGKEVLDPAWNFVDANNTPLQISEYPVNKILANREPLNDYMLGIQRSAISGIVWVMVNGFPVMTNQGHIKEILISFIDITRRIKVEESLRESELKYRSLIESSSDAIFCVDQNGEYQFTNHLFASTFGKNPDYFIGKTFWDVYPKEHAEYRYEATKRVFQTGESESLEVTVPLPDRTLYFYATANPIKDETGKVILSLTHAVDITNRKLAEEKVKSLLAEKELVLKEVHHRIKNNMNTMMSLLSLQAGNARDGFARAELLDAEKRMHSMGLLYDKLYQSVEFNKLPIEIYLTALVDEVVENFPNSHIVKVEKYFGDFILDANQLQPLGMIINELITNSMKYAFQGRDHGSLTVSAKNVDASVTIIIKDDGTGIPESISWENSTGFGLQLVKELTKQLNGTIRIERGNGTNVILEFAG